MEAEERIALRLTGVTGGYTDGKLVVSGIDLPLQGGRTAALIGPNGAGKTTILRAITRQLPHVGGGITIGGEDASRYSRRRLAQTVALTPSSRHASGILVMSHTLLGRTPHRSLLSMLDSEADLRIAQEALEEMGIAHLASRTMEELSEGQRQMASIAQALAQTPQVLLLDEPTANLDPANQQRILSTVKRIAQTRGIAVLATLHDINTAYSWADHVAIVKEGKIVCQGPPTDVMTPRNLSTAYGVRFTLTTAFMPTSTPVAQNDRPPVF